MVRLSAVTIGGIVPELGPGMNIAAMHCPLIHLKCALLPMNLPLAPPVWVPSVRPA